MREIAIRPGLQMILAGINHITTLSLPRENGRQYIQVGTGRFRARKINYFTTGTIRCRLEITKNEQLEIRFTLSGSQPLMLALPLGVKK